MITLILYYNFSPAIDFPHRLHIGRILVCDVDVIWIMYDIVKDRLSFCADGASKLLVPSILQELRAEDDELFNKGTEEAGIGEADCTRRAICPLVNDG